MTSSTAVAEQEAGTEHPHLDAPERAALVEMVRAEIRKARPYPVAEKTLALIVQAAVEPQAEPPGYRILDRRGTPRLHAALEGGAERPFTLADLLDEQRAKHPGLFLPPEPEPAPAPPEAVEARDSSLAAGASEVRAATARFFESQSERARSLAEQSSVQGRALAQSAAGAFASLRGRLQPEAVAGEDAPVEAPAERAKEGLAEPQGRRSRFWLAGGAVAAGLMILVAVAVNGPRTPEPSSAPAPGKPEAASGKSEPAPAKPEPAPAKPEPAPAKPEQVARAPAVPDNVTPPPEGDGRGEPDPDAPPVSPNAITGPVQVIDTATLKLNGRLIHLFGVEWVRGGQADELARYIAGRPVTCQPAPGSESMNCLIDGRDLSEVVLYNGGGRASSEASPELVAAEDHARSERLGVWKR